jgi:molecular chaperone DnaK
MANANKSIGRFELMGIPAAPRGIPQVEVTFDIDANGILHVNAKDLATGKEQSIRIQASSGLSEEEIKKMVRDAEQHAEDDKKRKDLVDAKNHADGLIYSTEKTLSEVGEKLDDATKNEINNKLATLKKATESDDINNIKNAQEELLKASHKLAEILYKQASSAKEEQPADSGASSQSSTKKDKDDDVVDADFEEVK